jgi:hypothetical protein
MFYKLINLKKFNNRLKNIFSSSKNKVEDVTVYDLVDLENIHDNSVYCFFYRFLSYFNRRNFINNLFGFILLYGTIFSTGYILLNNQAISEKVYITKINDFLYNDKYFDNLFVINNSGLKLTFENNDVVDINNLIEQKNNIKSFNDFNKYYKMTTGMKVNDVNIYNVSDFVNAKKQNIDSKLEAEVTKLEHSLKYIKNRGIFIAYVEGAYFLGFAIVIGQIIASLLKFIIALIINSIVGSKVVSYRIYFSKRKDKIKIDFRNKRIKDLFSNNIVSQITTNNMNSINRLLVEINMDNNGLKLNDNVIYVDDFVMKNSEFCWIYPSMNDFVNKEEITDDDLKIYIENSIYGNDVKLLKNISDNISKHYEITDDFNIKEKYLELR